MATSSSTAVPFAQGQDVAKLRAVVDMSTKEVKDYAVAYEDQHVIVEALDTVAHADPANKPKLDILVLRERRLEANRETAAMSNLSNYLVADNIAVQGHAVATVAMTVPAAPATTPSSTTSAEKKIIKRNVPEPRDGWKYTACKLHRAHSDAMSYHKTMSAILWQIVEIKH
jgi:hypothetical protein